MSLIQCPNCKRFDFSITEKFNPNITPHGGMVQCLLPYPIDWLTVSTTLCSEMTCPECLAQLAPSGRLTIFEPKKTLIETEEEMQKQFKEIDEADAKKVIDELSSVPLNSFPVGEGKIRIPMEEKQTDEEIVLTPKTGKPVYICEVCGKEVSSPLALSGHLRSHKKEKQL
jgi:hypothetical protein